MDARIRQWSTLLSFGALSLALLRCGGCADEELSKLDVIAVPSASAVEFGDVYVGAATERALAVQNLGTAPMVIRAVGVDGDAFSLVEEIAGTVVAPSSSLDISLEFRPPSATGHTGTLTIENDSGNAPELVVTLRGTGLEPLACDDGNQCTEDRFEPNTGACVHTERSGACDDGSLCTEDDVCSDGACLGVAVECDDSQPCTRDLCDPTAGCVFVPDASVCDDGNPCSSDVCDPESGCHNDDLPNGTSCGPGEECVTAEICLFGACTEVGVPNGVPCDDEKFCTVDDVCSGGECVGSRVERAPELTAFLPTFAGLESQAALLPDGRVVVADAGGGAYRTAALSVLSRVGNQIRRVSSSTVAGTTYTLAVLDAEHVGALVRPAERSSHGLTSTLPVSFDVYRVDGAGNVAVRSSVSIPDLAFPRDPRIYTASSPGKAFYFMVDSQPGLHIVDVSDMDTPVHVVDMSVPSAWLGALVVDPLRDRLLVGAFSGLEVFDIATSTAPQHFGTFFGGTTAASVGVGGNLVYLGQADVQQMQDSTLRLLDATSYAELASVPFPGYGVVGGGISPSGDRLVVTSSSAEVTLFDTSTPTMPVAIATKNLPFGGTRDQKIIVGDRVATYGNGRFGGWSTYFFGVEPGERLLPLTGAGHGSVQELRAQGTGLYVLSAESANYVDLLAPTPRFLSGTIFEQQKNLYRLSPQGTVPTVFLNRTYNEQSPDNYGRQWQFGEWVDVSNPSSPQAIGTVSFGGATSPVTILNDDPAGRYIYAATRGTSGTTMLVYDLSSAPLGFNMTLAPVGSVELWSDWSAYATFSVDASGSRVLAKGLLRTPQGMESTRLVMVDVSDPIDPRVIAATTLPGYHQSAAVKNDAVVTLEHGMLAAALRFPIFEFDGFALHRFDRSGTDLVFTSSAAIVDGGHVLAFDGETALVSTHAGLEIVDTTSNPPRYDYTIEMPQHPTSVTTYGNDVIVGSQRGVSVVYPPCPPE